MAQKNPLQLAFLRPNRQRGPRYCLLHVKAWSLSSLSDPKESGSMHGEQFRYRARSKKIAQRFTALGRACRASLPQPHFHVARYNGAPPHTQRPILKICQAILPSSHFYCKINLLLTCFRADTTCFHLLQVAQKYDIFSYCSQQQRGP